MELPKKYSGTALLQDYEAGDRGNETRSMSRTPVHMKSVSIGSQAVPVVVEQRLSVRFNQHFLNEIQMRQKGVDRLRLKLMKGVTMSTTELNLAPEAEIRETKKDKCMFPPKSQHIKPKKPSNSQQMGAVFPQKATNTAGLQRLNTTLVHLRLRYRMFQHPKAKDSMPFNTPFSPEATGSPIHSVPAKAKDAPGKVTLTQLAPYRVAVDFNMYRNVKKLAEGRLRALFDSS
jgi:hypothetical protein